MAAAAPVSASHAVKCARSVTAVPHESKSRYLVGTLCLRDPENQIHLLEYEEDRNAIQALKVFPVKHEVWDISASHAAPGLICTIFNDATGNGHQAAIHRLPADVSRYSNSEPLEQVAELPRGSSVQRILWNNAHAGQLCSLEDSGALRLWTLEAGLGAVPAGEVSVATHPLVSGCWNPHDPNTVAVVTGTSVQLVDLRSRARAGGSERAHAMPARDVDFNPKRQHLVVTAGDDCRVRFWDDRNWSGPVLDLGGHTHWVWQSRYNPFHDQLVLSAGSDTQVLLWRADALSSAAGANSAEVTQPVPHAASADAQVCVYDEHEDSVYSVAWSRADPWNFASVSYDGRVSISTVPRNVKYAVLL